MMHDLQSLDELDEIIIFPEFMKRVSKNWKNLFEFMAKTMEELHDIFYF